jgi:chromosome segregation ATPase
VNKFVIIAVVAVSVITGIAIAYFLGFAPAVQLVESIQQTISGTSTEGEGLNLNLGTIASGASLATAATTAIGWVKSNKDKALAQADAVKQTVANSELLGNINDIKKVKDDLASQLNEVTSLKDTALAEVQSTKDELEKIKKEKDGLQSQIDALHNLIPEIKNKVQEKIVVK